MYSPYLEKLSSCESMPSAISIDHGNAKAELLRTLDDSRDESQGRVQSSKKVAILLCTMQGELYLRQQLDSIGQQSYSNWEIFVSDDGSKDQTLAILEEYQLRWGKARLSIRSGPRKGFASNFLSLVCDPGIEADYYAYADQDDIWQTDKLHRAVECLEQIPANIARLYCGRTYLIDGEDRQIGYAPLFCKPPSFSNALVQNIGGGNTMVFNSKARELLRHASAGVTISAHDWWTYLVISGCGGLVHYDPEPSVQYRQHNRNLHGSNVGLTMSLRRIYMLLQGQFKEWNTLNIQALQGLGSKLTPSNQDILNNFQSIRSASLLVRIKGFYRSRIYRQTLLGNVGLVVAAIFKKI